MDIKISMKIDKLEKEYEQREKLFPKLEHAKNVLDSTGKRPTHKTGDCPLPLHNEEEP